MRHVTLIIGLILLLPLAARADITVPLSHAKLHLPVPEGYCAVDTDRARESALFDFEAKSFGEHARLLAVAADCAELESYRQRSKPIERLVSFAAAIRDGQL